MGTSLYPIRKGVTMPGVAADLSDGAQGDFIFNTTLQNFRFRNLTGFSQAGGSGSVALTDVNFTLNNASSEAEIPPLGSASDLQINLIDSLNKTFVGNLWVSSSALQNSPRYFAQGSGTQNAGVSAGGAAPGGTPSSVSELFNGGSWISSGNLGTARFGISECGVQNAALTAGGFNGSPRSESERFNGSSWSSTSSLNAVHYGPRMCGLQNTALCVGGFSTGGGVTITTVEQFNGSSWSTVGSLNSARAQPALAGLASSATVAGGSTANNTAFSNSAEYYSGTAWSNLSATMSLSLAAGQSPGTASNMLLYGFQLASGAVQTLTQVYNGLSFNTTTTPNTPITQAASGGSANLALCGGGTDANGNSTGTTQKFFGSFPLDLKVVFRGANSFQDLLNTYSLAIQEAGVLTIQYQPSSIPSLLPQDQFDLIALGLNSDPFDGAWSTAGNLTVAKYAMSGAGTANASLCVGGNISNAITAVDKYNGSFWSYHSDLNTGRYYGAGCGSFSAAIAFCGNDASSNTLATSEKWSGSSWSFGPNLATGRSELGGFGIQNGAMAFAGQSVGSFPPGIATAEFYNGILWSNANSLSQARKSIGGFGIRAAGIAIGGRTASTTSVSTVDKFNGSSWFAAASLLTAKYYVVGSGTATNGFTSTGDLSSTRTNLSERYNGAYWLTGPNSSVAKNSAGGAGFRSSTINFGGFNASANEVTSEKYLSGFPDPFV